jgi:hypothetical protein
MTDNLDLFDTGDARRDRDIAQVLEHQPWTLIAHVTKHLATYSKVYAGMEFTAQDFREAYGRMGGHEPTHPNAWGALFRNALKAGLIQATGRYRKSTAPASHSRMVQIYVGKA